MTVSEILRALLDKLEKIENPDVLSDLNASDDDEPKMMPPLTQRTELLKKAVGVESEFDDDSESDCGCDVGIDSELQDIRKRAGIVFLGDDEPFGS